MRRAEIDVPGPWANRAACLHLPAEAKKDFFPPENPDVPTGKASRAARIAATARAVKVCAGCSVRRSCLQWAHDNNLHADHDGILGGETPQQRRNNQLRIGKMP